MNGIELKTFNTFGIPAKAKELHFIKDEGELKDFYGLEANQYYILGSGSNILIVSDINAIILKNEIKGKEIIHEDDNHVIVRIGGGEVWHEFVLWTIEKGFSGIENLSLIPGTVGAAPVQNIGAYGVEMDELFVRCEGIHLQFGKAISMNKEACEFKYRDSIFKNSLKGKIFITRVHFKLNKKCVPRLDYGDIRKVLMTKNIVEPTASDISNAIIQIRKSKLPDPIVLGNAGSFFKNPIISKELFVQLNDRFPDIPHYEVNELKVKLPAGWLIEKCGWKGKREGDAGCHDKQALVLVNYNSASGDQILRFAHSIIDSVLLHFGICLEMEVNIWK
ncbi:MAG: UDP-N-acetylmuramate dehydrogenase [Saprospiraceae bacterium]|nr:UDP-N-acetylmuramate dehydrogenase [Saprospiraceae bacterium]